MAIRPKGQRHKFEPFFGNKYELLWIRLWLLGVLERFEIVGIIEGIIRIIERIIQIIAFRLFGLLFLECSDYFDTGVKTQIWAICFCRYCGLLWLIGLLCCFEIIAIIAKKNIWIIQIIAKDWIIHIIQIIHITAYRWEQIWCASLQSWKKVHFWHRVLP